MKSVFITGGTTGIGAELAKLYLADGYRVGVCGRSREKFESSFGNVENLFFYELDVSDKDKTASVINEFCHGHSLDILYANAGIGVGHKGRLPDFNKYQKVLDINLNGFLYTVEPAFKIMNQQGYGHIIGMASVAGFSGLPGTGTYSASKAGVIKLCEGWYLDWRRFGITVSCICPGFVKTPLTDLNDHTMPFMLDADVAAKRMKRAMDKKKIFYCTPKRMYLLTRFLEILPRFLYRKIMTFPAFDYSKE